MKGFHGVRPVVDVVEAVETKTHVPTAHITAQPHLPVGLGERVESVGTMGSGSDHIWNNSDYSDREVGFHLALEISKIGDNSAGVGWFLAGAAGA